MWSGLRGWSVLATVGNLIQGYQPTGVNEYPLTSGTATIGQVPNPDEGPDVAPRQSSGSVASVAMQYIGHPYRLGSAPGIDASRPWDCSSFLNYVVAVKLGRAIPGYAPGKYKGTVHGPISGQWAIWPGLAKIRRDEVQANDVLIFVGHVGIAINPNQMISALNPRDKTKVTTIDHFGKPLVKCGRLK